MDERKRSSQLKKILLYSSLFFIILFASYSTYIYLSLQKIHDPHSCFKTAMFKVDLCPKNKNYLRYSQVPKIFIRSLILSEDAAFFSHKGFDWHEIEESFRRNIKEWKFARGGSTLTQQLAKNLYLNPKKTVARKIQEFFIARELEKKLKKNQILEKYVNVVEFGKNIYGLNKASSHYFAKHSSQLNLLESVYLVSLLPSPKRLGKSFTAKALNKSNLWRMKIILGRLFRSGRITEEVYLYAKEVLREHPWPFPHYNEEFSYLGNSDEPEESDFAEPMDDGEEDAIDNDELMEDELKSLTTGEDLSEDSPTDEPISLKDSSSPSDYDDSKESTVKKENSDSPASSDKDDSNENETKEKVSDSPEF